MKYKNDTLILRGMDNVLFSRYASKIQSALMRNPNDKDLIKLDAFIAKEYQRRGLEG